MKTLYVSTDGDDQALGSLNEPLASLGTALELQREMLSGEKRRIVVRGGSYYDVACIVKPEDSGLEIVAAEGEVPVLYGGRLLHGWEKDSDGFYSVDLPDVASGDWDFRSLIVNGRPCPRARYPREGALRHESVFDVRWMSTTKGGWERKPTEDELSTLRFPSGQLPAEVEPRNLELTVYHAWDDSLVGVSSVDHANGIIRFSTPAGHPPGAFGDWKEHARTYVAWNVREGMHEPGQWYLDRAAGRVVYWPLPSEDMEEAHVIAPVTEALFRIMGTAEDEVVGVSIQGLTLQATTTPLLAGGFGAQRFEGAVSAVRVRDCRFADLHISNTGGQGIKIQEGVDSVCERCHIHQIGAGGVIANGDRITVSQNHIHHVGRTYTSAIGLRCGGTSNRIANNEIHHTPYSAVAAGGGELRVESNLFHHVMEELEDGAAVYIFGGKNCVVRGNHTHSVRNAQTHAYYLDEQCEGSVVEANVARGVPWPLHMHMARACTIRNNICTADGNLKMSLMNCDGFTVERNVLDAGEELSIACSYTGIAELRNNLFHSGAGKVCWEFHDRLPSLEANAVPVAVLPTNDGSVLGEPRVLEEPAGVFGFEAGSPAESLGIETIDVRRAGCKAREAQV